ncbi:DUF5313 domain-containing protein [Gordonia amicalis]|nr:DUF5313 domain-containing protein [Gordonia amicalis]
MTKPSFRQWLWYNLGGRLPDDMQDWVLHDLTGPGADARYLMRWTIPVLPLLLLFLLVPGPLWVSILMMIYILIPLIYFTIALASHNSLRTAMSLGKWPRFLMTLRSW